MKTRFHGLDRHKNYSTISTKNREGKEINYIGVCRDLQAWIDKLDGNDCVVMEASNGSFYWADQIEERGASCIIINPYKFKIIKDSWKKTDKIDARNMSEFLVIEYNSENLQLPTVYKPHKEIRELRKYFAGYNLLKRHQISYKNHIQAQLTDEGVKLEKEDKKALFDSEQSEKILENFNITDASKTVIRINLKLLWEVLKEKERIRLEILYFGKFFEKEIRLLQTIKGVSAFLVLAFLSDVADVKRFKKLKQMNAYLGVVCGVKSSGGKSYSGHINKASRKIARSLFTQSIHHIINSNPVYRKKYEELAERRGAGRARIAFIRKIFGVMRRMLINETEFNWKDEKLYTVKLTKYLVEIKNYQEVKESS